uniref:Reverse transcriptase domain-containing protein n=1 Tax=Monopterus albus TaxID=43700 RepID=A0A3Q3QIR5_MONAL
MTTHAYTNICDNEVSYGTIVNFIEKNQHSMFLKPIEEKEVRYIINKCDKSSTDSDGINMTIIKSVIEGCSRPLTYIFNLSFQKGKFPNCMKTAKVIPLYKCGDRHNITNYRPISLLSQFSKILEKLFNARLDKFLDKHKILTEKQYGFRSNRSTVLAITEFVEGVTSAWDNKKHTLGIFIDFQKAFDTINFEILLDKLERYGIRGLVLKWIKSYLSNRRQFVSLGGHQSDFLDIVCGVPQGSVLGPKLFILYINDICYVSELLNFVLFADDTTVWASGEDLQQLLGLITLELDKVKKWCDRNKLSLNLKKTKFILFGYGRLNHQIQVRVGDANIGRVYETKFLGINIDDKICWKPHIKYIHNKLAKSISILARVKNIVDWKSLHILYCSMFVPYLDYCVECWGNTYKSALWPLFILQKRAIRIVHGLGYRDHMNSSFALSVLFFVFLI